MEKKKRLLQINVTANWGSTGRIAEEIGRLALAQGWESWIACRDGAFGEQAGGGPAPSASTLIRVGGRLAHSLHYRLGRIFDCEGLCSRLATHSLVRKIKAIGPDIVQIHNIHGAWINYPILFHYLKKSGIPVVWTFHDCWPFTGHCAHFDGIGCGRWKVYCHDCPNLGGYPRTRFDGSLRNFLKKEKAYGSMDNLFIVSVSRWLEAFIEDSFLGGHGHMTIHNGIDLKDFTPLPLRLFGQEKPVVLGVASVWDEKKGLSDLSALSHHEDIKVVAVGVSEELRKNLPSSLICLPRTTGKRELAEIYSSADVFVNPTYEDNFPTVNIEALACGTPVVTYRTGGSPEALTPETGKVVEKGDVEGLYAAVISITGRPGVERKLQRDKCAARGRLFGAEERFREYLNLYASLMGGRKVETSSEP